MKFLNLKKMGSVFFLITDSSLSEYKKGIYSINKDTLKIFFTELHENQTLQPVSLVFIISIKSPDIELMPTVGTSIDMKEVKKFDMKRRKNSIEK